MAKEKQAKSLSFVAESLALSDLKTYNCVDETEESLRHLVQKSFSVCFGPTRLRSLTQEEIDQMEKFKSNPDGKRFDGSALTDSASQSLVFLL